MTEGFIQKKEITFKELLMSKGEKMTPKHFIQGKHAIEYKEFIEQNLVCPKCKGIIEIIMSQEEIRCMGCGIVGTFKDGIPCFFPRELTSKQQIEFDSLSRFVENIEKYRSGFRKSDLWELVDQNGCDEQMKVIVIGGSYYDNLPYVRTPYKWNVDHISHKYPELNFQGPELAKQGGCRDIAAKSNELPFPDGYADIVYSSNSLDHVDTPISTLVEISRIMKKSGKLYISVYYNSGFDDGKESTVIDEEFIKYHIENLFSLEYEKVSSLESKGIQMPLEFSLPMGKRMGWLDAVCSKKPRYTPYVEEDIVVHEKLIKNFESALYWDNIKYRDEKHMLKAIDYYRVVLGCKPFLKTDVDRQLYSRIRYLALAKPKAFGSFFKEFADNNKDPYWWKVVIDSSCQFQRHTLLKSINKTFTGREHHHLVTYLGSKPRYAQLRKFIRRSAILYPMARYVRNMLYSKN